MSRMVVVRMAAALTLSAVLAGCAGRDRPADAGDAPPADTAASTPSIDSAAPTPTTLDTLDAPAAPRPPGADMVRVASPRPGESIASPLLVTGEARGPWYFEADFPVRLFDQDGHELALGVARARGEWMTEDFVPFEVTLTFTAPAGESGTLVLERSNPSGEPRHAAEVRVPVRFR